MPLTLMSRPGPVGPDKPAFVPGTRIPGYETRVKQDNSDRKMIILTYKNKGATFYFRSEFTLHR